MKIQMTIPVIQSGSNAIAVFNIHASSLTDPKIEKIYHAFIARHTQLKIAKKDYIYMYLFVTKDFHVTDLVDENIPTLRYSDKNGLSVPYENASWYSISWYNDCWYDRNGVRFRVKPTKARLDFLPE